MWKPLRALHFGRNIFNTWRCLSTSRLENKSLLSIQGRLAADFLQGLITNDMSLIGRPKAFMYSFILNVKGRVITDAFIYNLEEHNSREPRYLMELDQKCAPYVAAYLSKYNIRKKVKISTDESVSVWIVMPPHEASLFSLASQQSWLPLKLDESCTSGTPSGLYFYAFDPRGIPGWSGRILLRSDIEASRIFTGAKSEPVTLVCYNRTRWRLGLPEGPGELLRNESLPLEANADLSGAVSFSKGCYIGQELTARTRFTGVVRRRYVPVRLTPIDTNRPLSIQPGDQIDLTHSMIVGESSGAESGNDKPSRPLGWLRAFDHNFENPGIVLEGLALLRLSEAAGCRSKLRVSISRKGDNQSAHWYHVEPFVPFWWPETISPELPRNTLH